MLVYQRVHQVQDSKTSSYSLFFFWYTPIPSDPVSAIFELLQLLAVHVTPGGVPT